MNITADSNLPVGQLSGVARNAPTPFFWRPYYFEHLTPGRWEVLPLQVRRMRLKRSGGGGSTAAAAARLGSGSRKPSAS